MVLTEKSQTISWKKPGKSQTIFCLKTPIFQQFYIKSYYLGAKYSHFWKNVWFLRFFANFKNFLPRKAIMGARVNISRGAKPRGLTKMTHYWAHPRRKRKFSRFFRRFWLNLKVFGSSVKDASEILWYLTRKKHMTSSFLKFRGGTAPGCPAFGRIWMRSPKPKLKNLAIFLILEKTYLVTWKSGYLWQTIFPNQLLYVNVKEVCHKLTRIFQ